MTRLGARDTGDEFWEAQYASTDRMWSGRAYPALPEIVTGTAPGRSLDVGCGEGADVLWLAGQGWDALGIDLAPTAIARARQQAREAALPTARFHVADLADWDPGEGAYDLVTAFFIHTHDSADRIRLLRRAAELVAVGGRLLIVSHATMPPWAHDHDHHGASAVITPDEERSAVGLVTGWAPELMETRSRAVNGPDGTHALLEDSILCLRRLT